MPRVEILWLVLMGLVWLFWVFVMFRTLFRLLKVSLARRAAQGAGYLRWVVINLGVYRDFFILDEFRRDRRLVIGLTVLLFGIILLRIYILGL